MRTDVLRALMPLGIAFALTGCEWVTGSVDPAVYDVTASLALEPDDPFYQAGTPYPLQWTLSLIGMPRAWGMLNAPAIAYTVQPVTVAVIDSGVAADHPDLTGTLVAGYDFNRGEPIPNGVTSTAGSVRHGTHVAGTIAARSNNGMGVAGIGWGDVHAVPLVRIMPLKVLDYAPSIETSRGGIGELAQAILFAAGLPNESGVTATDRAAVINMSLGADFSPLVPESEAIVLESACIAAREAGVVLVAAAGNQGASPSNGGIDYPARFASVLAVGSVDGDRGVSSFSERGEPLFVVGPGGYHDALSTETSVLSTSLPVPESGSFSVGYRRLAGTSMASPHVAGTIAILRAMRPDLSVGEVEEIVAATAEDIEGTGWDETSGWGLVRADEALETAWDLRTARSARPSRSDGETPPSRTWAKRVSTEITALLSSRASAVSSPPSETAASGYRDLHVVLDPARLVAAEDVGTYLSALEDEFGVTFRTLGNHFIRRVSIRADQDPARVADALSGDARVLTAAPVGGDVLRAAVEPR